ncbi:MAG: class I SAM-dependent methyltransferase [Rhodospirillales bacterium]|nr:class I SAM-dependent methyltransferase [Rhodospirillales bacterium]MBO6787719.1 class I SAM-dependent methyltransferase [Rhodospirillales bacterium]
MEKTTREAQYSSCFDVRDRIGMQPLGIVTNLVWYEDPRHLLFMLARYKFVAKMLEGRDRVLEIGCGDGFASRIVRQAVGALTAVDFDPVFIEDAKSRVVDNWPIDYRVHDILDGPVDGPFDAAYSIDVFEHIEQEKEDLFLNNVIANLTDDGVLVIGCPSLESQAYASPRSKEGHVNCKTGPELKACLEKHFSTVMMFSMNDEVVHTGFHKMAHYLYAICSNKRDR